jgi:hypothetical protein
LIEFEILKKKLDDAAKEIEECKKEVEEESEYESEVPSAEGKAKQDVG